MNKWRLTYLEREGFVLLELDQQDWLLVVGRHELALRIPVRMHIISHTAEGGDEPSLTADRC